MKQYNHIDDEDKEHSLLINASQDTDFIPKVDSGGNNRNNNNKLKQHDNTSQCLIEDNSNSFLDEINVTIDSIINDALPYDRKHLNKFLSSIKGHLKLLSAKINKNKIEIESLRKQLNQETHNISLSSNDDNNNNNNKHINNNIHLTRTPIKQKKILTSLQCTSLGLLKLKSKVKIPQNIEDDDLYCCLRQQNRKLKRKLRDLSAHIKHNNISVSNSNLKEKDIPLFKAYNTGNHSSIKYKKIKFEIEHAISFELTSTQSLSVIEQKDFLIEHLQLQIEKYKELLSGYCSSNLTVESNGEEYTNKVKELKFKLKEESIKSSALKEIAKQEQIKLRKSRKKFYEAKRKNNLLMIEITKRNNEIRNLRNENERHGGVIRGGQGYYNNNNNDNSNVKEDNDVYEDIDSNNKKKEQKVKESVNGNGNSYLHKNGKKIQIKAKDIKKENDEHENSM